MRDQINVWVHSQMYNEWTSHYDPRFFSREQQDASLELPGIVQVSSICLSVSVTLFGVIDDRLVHLIVLALLQPCALGKSEEIHW